MRTLLMLGFVLCSQSAFAAPNRPAKDDFMHSTQRRSVYDPSGKSRGSIEISRTVSGGTTTIELKRPGRHGEQTTKWSRASDGRVTRKVVAGMTMQQGRPDHYFVSAEEPSAIAQLTHSVQHAPPVAEPGAHQVAAFRAAERDPARWGAPNPAIRMGWNTGPYRLLAEKFGLDYAETKHQKDVRELSAQP